MAPLAKALIKWRDPNVRKHLEHTTVLNTATPTLITSIFGYPGIGKSTLLNHILNSDNTFTTGAGGATVTAGADVYESGGKAFVDLEGFEQAAGNMDVLKLVVADWTISDVLLYLTPTPTRNVCDNTLDIMRDILSIAEAHAERGGYTYGPLHIIYSNYSASRHHDIVTHTRNNCTFLHQHFRDVVVHTLPHPTQEHDPIAVPCACTSAEYRAAISTLKESIFRTAPVRSGATATTLLHKTVECLNTKGSVPFSSIRRDVFSEQYRKKVQDAVRAHPAFTESNGKLTMKEMVTNFYVSAIEGCKSYIKSQALLPEDVAYIFQRCERETYQMMQDAVESVQRVYDVCVLRTSTKSRAHPYVGDQETRQNGRTFTYRRCGSCRCAVNYVTTGCVEYTTYSMRDWDTLVTRPTSSVYAPTASCAGVVDCNHKPYGSS